MFNSANPVSILVPVLAVVALTFIAFIKMAAMRAAAVKGGQDPNYYRAHLGTPEPEATVAAVRHWDNLFEAPTLFYAGAIAAYALGAVSGWTLIFAWGFAVLRILQSAVHMTSNAPNIRGLFFSLSLVFVFALWVNVGFSVLARV